MLYSKKNNGTACLFIADPLFWVAFFRRLKKIRMRTVTKSWAAKELVGGHRRYQNALVAVGAPANPRNGRAQIWKWRNTRQSECATARWFCGIKSCYIGLIGRGFMRTKSSNSINVQTKGQMTVREKTHFKVDRRRTWSEVFLF